MSKKLDKLLNSVLFYREVSIKQGVFDVYVTKHYGNIEDIAREAFHSNKIEGNTISLGNTVKIVASQINKSTVNTGDPLVEVLEVRGFVLAVLAMFNYLRNGIYLSEDLIKSLHYELMSNTLGYLAGEYRNEDVKPAGSKTTVYTEWQRVELEMQEHICRFNNSDKSLISILDFKIDFILTHPFLDGNGRLSRLLLNYLLIQNNFVPIVIPSDERDTYINTLKLASKGNYEPYYVYICEKLRDTYVSILNT